ACGQGVPGAQELWEGDCLAASHARRKTRNVGPGRKSTVAGAGQDERAGTVIVLDRVEHLHQSIDQCVIERVELFGPIQRDEREAPLLLDQNNFRHRGRPGSQTRKLQLRVISSKIRRSAASVRCSPYRLNRRASSRSARRWRARMMVSTTQRRNPRRRGASRGGIAMARQRVKSRRGAMAFMVRVCPMFEAFSFVNLSLMDVDRCSRT